MAFCSANYRKSDTQLWCEFFQSYSRGTGHSKALWGRYTSYCTEKGQKAWREDDWAIDFEDGEQKTTEKTARSNDFIVTHVSTMVREFVTFWEEIENPVNSPHPPVEEWFKRIWGAGEGWLFVPRESIDEFSRNFLCRELACQRDGVMISLSIRIPVKEVSRSESVEYFLSEGIAKARHRFTNYEHLLQTLRDQGNYSHEFYKALRECVDAAVVTLLKQIKRKGIYLR